jgi:chromosome segregation ATPase
MPSAREVSFELERFEWLADDRLEVLGRWNGLRGSRHRRPALTVESGGRRHRLAGTLVSEDPWLAAFSWSGGDIATAELELGRTLVVELPPPRRRRRRSATGTTAAVSAEGDLRAQVEELRAMVADLRAERAAAPTPEDAERLAEAAERHQREAAELREEVASLRSGSQETADIPAVRDEALARAEAAEAALAEAREAAAAALAERDEARAEEQAALAEALERVEAALAERDEARAQEQAALAEALERVEAVEAERDEARAQLAAQDAPESAELAGLRLAHGSLRAAHEQLEDEVEALRGVREERDRLAAELEHARAGHEDDERARADLGEVIRRLQDRAAAAEGEQLRLERALAEAVDEASGLREELAAARAEAETRIESERATTTEVHARLATAREETERTIAAEAEETERLRTELSESRDAAERQLAAERAEVARLREELISRAEDADAGEAGEASRRMLERITRDLERERAKAKMLQRELDALRSESAGARRAASAATANGAPGMEDAPAPATVAGRAGRTVATPAGTRRRVDAARHGAAQRVPKARPSQLSLWAVRIAAAAVVAVLGIALVILVSWVT